MQLFRPHLNPERCPLPYLGLFDIDMSFVIFLHDSLGQRKTQAPAALLGREDGSKHIVQVLLLNTLARILHVNNNSLIFFRQRERDNPLALHRINGILTQVLYHPLKQ